MDYGIELILDLHNFDILPGLKPLGFLVLRKTSFCFADRNFIGNEVDSDQGFHLHRLKIPSVPRYLRF